MRTVRPQKSFPIRCTLGVAFALLLIGNSIAQTSDTIPSHGLVGYWPFNGNAKDASGYGNHGVIKGKKTFTQDRFGNDVSAYQFSSVTQKITIEDSPVGPFLNNFSVSFWFVSEGDVRMQPINFNNSNGGAVSNLNFAFNDLFGCWIYWQGDGANNFQLGQIGEFTDNFWHNALLLRSNDTLKIYIDGKLLDQKYNDEPFCDGCEIELSGSTYTWMGAIDDLAIYDRALTEKEIVSMTGFVQNQFQIISPKKTEAYPVGSLLKIKWLKPPDIDAVKLEYSVNQGLTWALISDDLKTNVFDWPVPDLPGHNCLIRITATKSPESFVTTKFLISKYRWGLVNDNAAFSARDGSRGYAFKEHMFLLGGWNPNDPINYPNVTNNEVWRSSDGVQWDLLTIAPFKPRHTFGSAVHDKKMWVLGGDQLQCGFQTDVWNSSDGITWNLINDNVPWGERMLHLYFPFRNKLWVMGGQKVVGFCNDEAIYYNDVWNSADGVTWNLVADSVAWSPRGQIGGSVVFKNRMWILGGGTYHENYYNDVWNSEDGIHWSLIAERAPWRERQYQNVAVFDSAMWIIGGYVGNEHLKDVWFSNDGVDWIELKGTPWPARHAAAAVTFDKSLWLIAGNLWNDVWRLDEVFCPDVIEQPADQLISSGSIATFSTLFATPSASYQWQMNEGTGWKSLTDNVDISGAATHQLVLSNTTSLDNGKLFRCIAFEGSCSDTTQIATLRVCPDFGIQPSDQSVIEGESATFVAKCINPSAFYQWQVDQGLGWVNLADTHEFKGTSTHTLTVVNAQFLANGHRFRNLVTLGGPCSDSSEVAELLVCRNFEVQPSDQRAMMRSSASFKVRYPDGPVTYQWQGNFGFGWETLNDGQRFSGTTTDSLVVHDFGLENNGEQFLCTISDGPCSLTSEAAILTLFTELATFPNPVEDDLTVTVDHDHRNSHFTILDHRLKEVKSGILKNEINRLNLSELAPGVYWLHLENPSRNFKLIKK